MLPLRSRCSFNLIPQHTHRQTKLDARTSHFQFEEFLSWFMRFNELDAASAATQLRLAMTMNRRRAAWPAAWKRAGERESRLVMAMRKLQERKLCLRKRDTVLSTQPFSVKASFLAGHSLPAVFLAMVVALAKYNMETCRGTYCILSRSFISWAAPFL